MKDGDYLVNKWFNMKMIPSMVLHHHVSIEYLWTYLLKSDTLTSYNEAVRLPVLIMSKRVSKN